MVNSTHSPLISTNQLEKIIDNPNLRLFDCRFYLDKTDKGRQLYESGHIPNSQYADLNQQLAGSVLPNTGRHPLPDKSIFENQLRQWGIDKNSQVVVYDDASGAISARLWWMCLWSGIDNVAVLDGGINSWESAANVLTMDICQVQESNYTAQFDDSLWISTDDLKQRINHGDLLLTDARAVSRFNGEVEPIDRLAGHVPGAVNLPFNHNLNDKGLFKSPSELQHAHNAKTGDQCVVSMCGSGVTACHNILARVISGQNLGSLYVGSWSEWITDKNRAIARNVD